MIEDDGGHVRRPPSAPGCGRRGRARSPSSTIDTPASMPIGMLTVPRARTTRRAESRRADEGGDDDHGQAQHDALRDAGHDGRHGIRQFDLPQELPLCRAERRPGFFERQGHRGDAEVGQADRRRDGEDHGRNQARRRAEVKQHQGRDQVDEGRQRLHQIEQGPQKRIEPWPMRRGHADRHADNDARQGREPDERNRLDRRLPVAEVGDEDEGRDHEGGQAPGAMQPIGQRRDGENDDEKGDMQAGSS